MHEQVEGFFVKVTYIKKKQLYITSQTNLFNVVFQAAASGNIFNIFLGIICMYFLNIVLNKYQFASFIVRLYACPKNDRSAF